MALSDMMSRDAVALMRSTDFGETVVYRPRDGGSFTIPAIVFREEPDQRVETSRARFSVATVVVRNHTDTSLGIASPNERGDRMDVVFRPGSAAEPGRVTAVLGGDEGMWTLEVAR